jgi:hypothetical protein
MKSKKKIKGEIKNEKDHVYFHDSGVAGCLGGWARKNNICSGEV